MPRGPDRGRQVSSSRPSWLPTPDPEPDPAPEPTTVPEPELKGEDMIPIAETTGSASATLVHVEVDESKTCPQCDGALIAHTGPGEKHGAWHCNACGICWLPDLSGPRPGQIGIVFAAQD